MKKFGTRHFLLWRFHWWCRVAFGSLANICNVIFYEKKSNVKSCYYLQGLKVKSCYLHKRALSQMFTRVLNTPLNESPKLK